MKLLASMLAVMALSLSGQSANPPANPSGPPASVDVTISNPVLTLPALPTVTIPPITTEPTATLPPPPAPTVGVPTLPIPTTTQEGGTTTDKNGTSSGPTPTTTASSENGLPQQPIVPDDEARLALHSALAVDTPSMQIAYSALGFIIGVIVGIAFGCVRGRNGQR